MRRYEWKYTWASRFNCSDTLLLVAGVVSDINGEIAVFMKITDNEKNKSNYRKDLIYQTIFFKIAFWDFYFE